MIGNEISVVWIALMAVPIAVLGVWTSIKPLYDDPDLVAFLSYGLLFWGFTFGFLGLLFDLSGITIHGWFGPIENGHDLT